MPQLIYNWIKENGKKTLRLDQGEEKQEHRLTNNIKSGYIKVRPKKNRTKSLILIIIFLLKNLTQRYAFSIHFFVHQHIT